LSRARQPARRRVGRHQEVIIPSRATSSARRSDRAFALAISLLALLAGGCVKVYQPVSGLQQPTVLDLSVGNFQDVALTVHCPSGDLVSPDEARDLCTKVGVLFENQGAVVTTDIGDRRFAAEPSGFDLDGEQRERAGPPPSTDLILELRGHQVHQKNHYLTWLMCGATFSLVPAVAEFTFAQDVYVRDEHGFLLASDTLSGRIVRYGGLGYWLGTKLTDRFFRKDDDVISASQKPHSFLSEDFYAQLSQLVFNAKMRWRVLEQANPDRDG
jgi:hypothetical protein